MTNLKVEELSLSLLKPDPQQPRTSMNPEVIQNIANSIKANGLINPIEVIKVGGQYKIVTGHQRYMALKQLKAKTARVQVVSGLSENEIFIRQISENVARGDMSPLDEANAVEKLWNSAPYQLFPAGTARSKAIAEALGVARSWIEDRRELIALRGVITKNVVNRHGARLGTQFARLQTEESFENGIPEGTVEAMAKKIRDGSMPSNDNAVRVIVDALIQNPDLTKQVMKKDYGKMQTWEIEAEMHNLAPTPRQQIRNHRELAEEICDQARRLSMSLVRSERYKKDLGELNLRKIASTLKTLDKDIKKWS